MSATPIAMPSLGMTMTEGRVVAWPLSPGDRVEKGQTILIIESEKAEVEVEATAGGTFRHVYVEPDTTVPCGALLGAITETADEPFDVEAFRREHDVVRPAPPQEAAAAAPAGKTAHPTDSAGGRTPVTPKARRRARDLGVDVARVAGSGPGGRVLVEDVEAFAAQQADRVRVRDDVALEVLREGDGDPVLLLPGFGTDVSAFARQSPALAEVFEVFGVNPRGVGASDAPEAERYDVDELADDVAAVVTGPAHIVGTSLGAAVAVALARRHPERVRSLALLAPLVHADGRLAAVTEMWCALAATGSAETLARTLLPWFFSPTFLGEPAQRERVVRGLASTLARVDAAALARTAAGLLAWRPPTDEQLSAIDVPTLVVVGDADLLTQGGEVLAKSIPGARCVTLEGAGHALGLEAPERVNEAILAHLRAV